MKTTTGTGITKRVNAISDNHNLSVNTPMTTARIELTGFCPFNCRFCYNQVMVKNKERQKSMTKEDFQIALDAVDAIGTIKEVGLFYMGESGIHPNLAEYYKQVKDKGYFTYFTTNALIICHTLQAIPYIDSLKVSWNYKDENDFFAKTGLHVIRQAKTYSSVLEHISKLYIASHKAGKKLSISTVLDAGESPEDYKPILSQLTYDEHYFMPVQTQCGVYKEGLGGVVGEYYNQASLVPCWSLFKGFYIDCDLNVRTCSYGHTKCHVLGNLKSGFDKDKLLLKRKHLLASLSNDMSKLPDICKNCLNCK